MTSLTSEALSELVLRIVKEYAYSATPVTLESTFNEINVDTVDSIELVMDIEDELAVELPNVEFNTGAQVLAALEKVLQSQGRIQQ